MVEQQLQNFGKPKKGQIRFVKGASLGGAGPNRSSSAALCGQTRNYTSGQRVEETRVGNRETSLEVVPFPPPEIRPLILVPHLPCAVSLKQRQISLEAVRGGDSNRNFYRFGTILWISFFQIQANALVEIFEKFRSRKNFFRWKFFRSSDRRISFFTFRFGIFFLFFLTIKNMSRKV